MARPVARSVTRSLAVQLYPASSVEMSADASPVAGWSQVLTGRGDLLPRPSAGLHCRRRDDQKAKDSLRLPRALPRCEEGDEYSDTDQESPVWLRDQAEQGSRQRGDRPRSHLNHIQPEALDNCRSRSRYVEFLMENFIGRSSCKRKGSPSRQDAVGSAFSGSRCRRRFALSLMICGHRHTRA